YIVELKDIQSVFINVHRSLNDGGLFIFDVHSLNYVESSLVNRTFAYKDDEIVYIWNCEEGDVEGEMFHDMTFFIKKMMDRNTNDLTNCTINGRTMWKH